MIVRYFLGSAALVGGGGEAPAGVMAAECSCGVVEWKMTLIRRMRFDRRIVGVSSNDK